MLAVTLHDGYVTVNEWTFWKFIWTSIAQSVEPCECDLKSVSKKARLAETNSKHM